MRPWTEILKDYTKHRLWKQRHLQVALPNGSYKANSDLAENELDLQEQDELLDIVEIAESEAYDSDYSSDLD